MKRISLRIESFKTLKKFKPTSANASSLFNTWTSAEGLDMLLWNRHVTGYTFQIKGQGCTEKYSAQICPSLPWAPSLEVSKGWALNAEYPFLETLCSGYKPLRENLNHRRKEHPSELRTTLVLNPPQIHASLTAEQSPLVWISSTSKLSAAAATEPCSVPNQQETKATQDFQAILPGTQ